MVEPSTEGEDADNSYCVPGEWFRKYSVLQGVCGSVVTSDVGHVLGHLHFWAIKSHGRWPFFKYTHWCTGRHTHTHGERKG